MRHARGARIAGVGEIRQKDGDRLGRRVPEQSPVHLEGVLEAACDVGHQVRLGRLDVDEPQVGRLEGAQPSGAKGQDGRGGDSPGREQERP